MSPMMTAALAFLGLIGLAAWCPLAHKTQVLSDLQTRSAAALQGAGIDPAGLSMSEDRRIAVLRGYEGSPIVSERAQQIVRDLRGVHDIRVEVIPRPGGVPEPVTRTEPARVQEQLREIVRLENVQFETNSAALTPKGIQTMEKVASVLKQAIGFPVEIQGHTDGRGERNYNLALSQQRANTCLQFLSARGLGANRFTAKGYGPDRPVASNDTEEGRLLNRRIEFSVKEVEIKKEKK